MCEWLSCSEWCDVQLLCRGRTFNAHRAVLASVSTFLRRILLSCPIDESPTFIVLPDFDLEAMSSVLYYIYNGEVCIQKQKLEMFIDIVKELQIFIDSQYLPLATKSREHAGSYSNTYHWVTLNSNKVFTLGDENCKDERYVHLKKGEQILETRQYLFSDLDALDKQVRYRDWSEQRVSPGNLQWPYEHRQRKEFLRDLFIETYPRNGNANGRTTSVLAIPNERYRAPTSVPLTNANGKHPRVDDMLSEMSKKTKEQSSLLLNSLNASKQPYKLHHNQMFSDSNLDNTQINNLDTTHYDLDVLVQKYNYLRNNCESTWTNSVPILPSPVLPAGLLQEIRSQLSLDLNSVEKVRSFILPHDTNEYQVLEAKKILHESFSKNDHKDRHNIAENKNKRSSLTRGSILNQVLQSPWCPRMPNNYRPFRRKTRNPTIVKATKSKDDNADSTNDSNNNIRTSTAPPPTPDDTPPIISSNETKETSNNYSIATTPTDFKCTVCDQVYNSSDSLDGHMRRHSSTARYSCTECSKSFSQLRNFKYHMSVHRGTREFAATCTVCGKYFNDRGYLSSHMKIHRNRKEYKCSLCPKSFNQRVAYNMHVRIHTGVKPHVCEECGKAFSRKMLLKQHQRTHSGERPYACAHCDKRFADRSNMTLHLRLHTGVKPFSCSLCPKSFTKKHHLKSHLNFHTGAKPYSCPRCKLAFTQSSNMRTHLKKCSAPAPAPGETADIARVASLTGC